MSVLRSLSSGCIRQATTPTWSLLMRMPWVLAWLTTRPPNPGMPPRTSVATRIPVAQVSSSLRRAHFTTAGRSRVGLIDLRGRPAAPFVPEVLAVLEALI